MDVLNNLAFRLNLCIGLEHGLIGLKGIQEGDLFVRRDEEGLKFPKEGIRSH